MRTRHPFPDVELGELNAYDLALAEHGMPNAEIRERYLVNGGDGSPDEPPGFVLLGVDEAPKHPDAVERGTAVPLGFMPHRAENRKTRRAAVATWKPPAQTEAEAAAQDAPQYPTRRELWRQRKRQRRGKLDPGLRAAQRKAGAK